MKKVLTIAGSDSCGGAGIQADLKTMCALGVYGMSVITAITAQNTQAVLDVQEASTDIVVKQIDAVYGDIEVDAVKIGMVSSEEIIDAIYDRLQAHKAKNIVMDPVMVSKSGFFLLREEAVEFVKKLISISDVVTPNIPEAELLTGMKIETESDMRAAARKITDMGATNVLIKGGHRSNDGRSDDLLMSKEGVFVLEGSRIDTHNTHGTGCTLSSAIACFLAKEKSTFEACILAKEYITRAIKDSFSIGHGVGPVGHLSQLYRNAGMDF